MADIIKMATAYILAPLKEHDWASAKQEDPFGPLIAHSGDIPETMREILEIEGILERYKHEGEELLGCYHGMSSPGRITLFGDTLRSLFWAIIFRLSRTGYQFWKEDLEALAQMTALKTWKHEQFHLFVDIQEHLAPGHGAVGRLMEEAMACAHSWQQLQLTSPAKRILPSLRRPFLALAFDYGHKPGYADWPQFSSEIAFQGGLLELFHRQELFQLEANGVPVGRLFLEQLNIMDSVQTVNVLA